MGVIGDSPNLAMATKGFVLVMNTLREEKKYKKHEFSRHCSMDG